MHLERYLPLFLRGRVVAGYGRGGKQLGCPTGSLFHHCEISIQQINVAKCMSEARRYIIMTIIFVFHSQLAFPVTRITDCLPKGLVAVNRDSTGLRWITY
ncbi:unnamed protein product [Heligmosomoides polygyrus]|uniref:Riboflavin kinase n=1 Tax=Heligmosomoides polygyrus TaxID=6339 RepID=A0A183F9H0_HELPZ|nr:unnamed protein product [Heligmosomoides polygyrus]